MTPRGLTKEQIKSRISHGTAVYDGYLKPHIRLIVVMWANGFSYQQILDQIAHIDKNPYHYGYGGGAGSIAYVLRRCGISLTPPRVKSCLDTFDVVAKAQFQWDRRRQALRMRAVGFTYRQIGERLGCSSAYARHMELKALLEKTSSPLEKYLRLPTVDKKLARSELVKAALHRLSSPHRDRDWLILAA